MPGVPSLLQRRLDEAEEVEKNPEAPEAALELPEAQEPEVPLRPAVEIDMDVGEDGSFDLGQFAVPLPDKVGDVPVVAAAQPAPLSPAERQHVAPDVLARMDSMSATIDGLRKEISDARSSGASLEELRQANTELQARIQQLTTEQNAAKADAGLQFDDVSGPSDEELALLDPRYVNVVRKMTDAAATSAAKKVYDAQQQVIQQLQGELASVRSDGAEAMRKAADARFRNDVSRAHPDVREVFSSEGFKAFIAKPVSPLSRDTISSLLNRVWNDQDAQQVSLIIDEYKKEVAASAASVPQPAPVVPAHKPTSVQPTSSAVSSVNPAASVSVEPKRLSYAKFREANRLFRARHPRMPKETYDRIEQMYVTAAREGRVVYD